MLAVAKEEVQSLHLHCAWQCNLRLMNYEYFCVPGPSSEK